jgi:hypothetical protein
MKKIISGLFAVMLTASMMLGVNPSSTLAWEQAEPGFRTHQEINTQALIRFFSAYHNNAKYSKAAVNKTQSYLGPMVSSSTLAQSGHRVGGAAQTFEKWVIHGGFSADEPHLWASIRHFYDPLAVNGVPELTDHNWVHGTLIGYEAISAKYWAFEDESNPFSWKKALEYYKRAMEIPGDSQVSVIPGSDFRDPELTVASPAEARETYLGKAFRSLGESMHMIADMTQPCHVRNDSHPTGDLDPLESTVTYANVLRYKDSPVDPRIGSQIDVAIDAQTMYEAMALYTNRYFYTDGTIYDNSTGVFPRNGEKPYPHPQFGDLTLDKLNPVKTYSGEFNGKPAPMVQQTYASYKLGGLWTNYIMPPSFTDRQSEVLLPVAIKADARLINLFFPTFELTMDVEENEDIEEQAGSSYKEFLIESELKHLDENDVEWRNQGFKIRYCGPAELWVERKGKQLHLADTEFKDGLIKEPLIVYTGDLPRQASDENVKKYQVQNEDGVYLVIKAGGRTITCDKFKFAAEPQISIEPSSLEGEPGTEYAFTGKTVNPPVKPRYDWFVDGKKVLSGPKTVFNTKFPVDNRYEISVQCLDETGKVVCEDTVTANITKDTECKTPPPKEILAKLQRTSKFKCELLNLPTTIVGAGSMQKWVPGFKFTKHFYVPGNAISVGGDGAMDIKWSGTSFSGVGTKEYPDNLTGSVCYSKGKVLVSFDYATNDPRDNLQMSVKNVPCDPKYFMDPKYEYEGKSRLTYMSTDAPVVKGYVTKLEWKSHEERPERDAPPEVWDASLTAKDWSNKCGFDLTLY